MSHKNVRRDLGTTPQWDAMEPGEYYQLRGWSAVMLNDSISDGVYIDLYSYDAHILRYYLATNELHAWQFERPFDVSTTTTRHINEFIQFLVNAIDLHGNHFDILHVSRDYPTTHTPNSWAFRGWSGDYDGCKPFWW